MLLEQVIQKKKIDTMIAGISCKNYSISNQNRHEGTRRHRDSDLLEAFVSMVKNPDYQKAVIHRQAAVRDSRLVRLSPKPAGDGFS